MWETRRQVLVFLFLVSTAISSFSCSAADRVLLSSAPQGPLLLLRHRSSMLPDATSRSKPVHCHIGAVSMVIARWLSDHRQCHSNTGDRAWPYPKFKHAPRNNSDGKIFESDRSFHICFHGQFISVTHSVIPPLCVLQLHSSQNIFNNKPVHSSNLYQIPRVLARVWTGDPCPAHWSSDICKPTSSTEWYRTSHSTFPFWHAPISPEAEQRGSRAWADRKLTNDGSGWTLGWLK